MLHIGSLMSFRLVCVCVSMRSLSPSRLPLAFVFIQNMVNQPLEYRCFFIITAQSMICLRNVKIKSFNLKKLYSFITDFPSFVLFFSFWNFYDDNIAFLLFIFCFLTFKFPPLKIYVLPLQ